jgi:hypothetical protein
MKQKINCSYLAAVTCSSNEPIPTLALSSFRMTSISVFRAQFIAGTRYNRKNYTSTQR